ncbi:hypothetical protein ACFLY0_00395 [Patescibacteria group bacterium]
MHTNTLVSELGKQSDTFADRLAKQTRGVVEKRLEEEALQHKHDVQESEKISAQMIKLLPQQMEHIAKLGGRYVCVDVFSHNPSWRKWNKPEMPRDSKQFLTRYFCNRYFDGIPKKVAIWAIKNGFRVDMAHVGGCGHKETYHVLRDSESSFLEEVADFNMTKILLIRW